MKRTRRKDTEKVWPLYVVYHSSDLPTSHFYQLTYHLPIYVHTLIPFLLLSISKILYNSFKYCSIFFGLFLGHSWLDSGITPDSWVQKIIPIRLGEQYGMLWIEPRLALCKTIALPAVLALWPHIYWEFLFSKVI